MVEADEVCAAWEVHGRCGVLCGDGEVSASGLHVCVLVVAIGNVDFVCGVDVGCGRGAGEVLKVLMKLGACVEALVDVVISGRVAVGPVGLRVVVVGPEPMYLGVEVLQSTSGLEGLLRL